MLFECVIQNDPKKDEVTKVDFCFNTTCAKTNNYNRGEFQGLYSQRSALFDQNYASTSRP